MKTALLASLSVAFLSTIIGDIAAQIIAVTAALAALGWMWSRMLVPLAKTIKRTLQAVDALEDLQPFMTETRDAVREAASVAAEAKAKAEMLDLRLDLIERHIRLFAAEDAVRTRAVMRTIAEGQPPPEPK
jgi:CBS domain containing-hemolysin-like protein